MLDNGVKRKEECLRDHPDIFETQIWAIIFFFFHTFRAPRCFICGQHLEISDVENVMPLPRVHDEKERGLACNINPLIISPFLKAVKLPP